MTPVTLTIDNYAPPRPVPIDCHTDPDREACQVVIIPLKKTGEENAPHYLRFKKQGDHFVLSEKNDSGDLAWIQGIEMPSQASIDQYAKSARDRFWIKIPIGSYPIRSYSDSLRQGRANQPQAQPRLSLWHFQAAFLAGLSFDKESAPYPVSYHFALGAGLGLRYFNPDYLGPVGFGLGMQYWAYLNDRAGAKSDDNFNNFTFAPALALQPKVDIPIDFSLGPLIGISEPLPGSHESAFTTGAFLQVNAGTRYFKEIPISTPDVLNFSGSLLVRPMLPDAALGGSIFIGINPIGIVNAVLP